jgi:MATE family multidrug resistance protein
MKFATVGDTWHMSFSSGSHLAQGGYLASLRDSFRQITRLAWPVLIGQLAVLGFGTVDTILVARFAAQDLAALTIGMAAYTTVFVGFMGVVLAISPVAGQLFGAGKLREAGHQARQAVWLALGVTLAGSGLLLFPEPFLALARPAPDVADKVRPYLLALAFSFPASLLFTVYRGFNVAVSRPKAVMALQVGGFLLKIPLSTLFIYGININVPGLDQPLSLAPMGVAGCGLATALVMWTQTLIAWRTMRKDVFYEPFGLRQGGLGKPDFTALKGLVRLGLPMGASILIEVTGFTFMAFLISRQYGQAVVGHQLAANLVSLMFMLPLALANGTATLVAQRVGANDLAHARRIGWHGLEIGVVLATLMGALLYAGREAVVRVYTSNPVIIAATMPLLVWLWWFHVADAAQTLANFVLRSHRVTLLPLVLYVTSLWGVGLLGGYWVTQSTWAPPELQGAAGYWAMATLGLVVASISLTALLAWVHHKEA